MGCVQKKLRKVSINALGCNKVVDIMKSTVSHQRPDIQSPSLLNKVHKV